MGDEESSEEESGGSGNEESEDPENEGAESQALPENEPSEENSESSSQSEASSGQTVEGMTAIEARALLDSMRDGEQLLPFVEQDAAKSGRQKPLKDW